MNKRLKILWIEDNTNMIYSLFRPLINDGHEVIIAEDEKEALQKLNDTTFDLIVLDIIIPSGENKPTYIPLVGMHLLYKISIEMKLKVPLIVLSVASNETMREAMELGVKKYLCKGTILPSQLKYEVYSTLGIPDVSMADENYKYD